MKEKKLILLTNDDGYQARGMQALIEAARPHGDVVVVAPDSVRSGMSHAITMSSPLFMTEIRREEGLEIYSCSGTPVDCVKLALDYMLCGRKVDMLCSGVNHGTNSSISVMYSGTMGAAIEGSFYGIPSVGFSLLDYSEDADFDASVKYASQMIGALLSRETELPLCLNVNIPKARPEEIRGIRLCRQCGGYWKEDFFCRKDPRGKDYFWLTGSLQNAEPTAEDTDEWALANNYIAVVPVQVDMTDYGKLSSLKDFDWTEDKNK